MAEKKGKTNIFIKYFGLFAVIITISFTILGFSIMTFIRNYWQDEKTNLLSQNVDMVANSVPNFIPTTDEMTPVWNGNKLMLANTLSVIEKSIKADIFITDIEGNVILCPERASGDVVSFLKCQYHDSMIIQQKFLDQIKANRDAETIVRGTITNDKTLYFIVGSPVMIAGDVAGYVLSTMPIKGNDAVVSDILKMLLISISIALLLSFAGAYFMTYWMMKPLQQMSKAARQFAHGDFSYRVHIHSNDEMAELADSFNEMASELATLEGSRRSFVANVSHELKTPMTTISGFIDGILDGTIPLEKQDYYLHIVSDEVKRLSRLVVAMLNMSKIESGDFKMQQSNYDIAGQIFKIFVTFEQKINQKKIDIRGLDKLESTFVHADPDMIYQVIFNLVDNAVKFTNEGGYIDASLHRQNGKVFIKIRNSGNGISPEELPKIFERFYKVDRSRSLDVRGAGLGLYIVKNMVELHGGQITVRSEENQYTEFEFWLSGGNTNE